MASSPLMPVLGIIEGVAHRHKFIATVSESHLALRANAALLWLSNSGHNPESKPQEDQACGLIFEPLLETWMELALSPSYAVDFTATCYPSFPLSASNNSNHFLFEKQRLSQEKCV